MTSSCSPSPSTAFATGRAPACSASAILAHAMSPVGGVGINLAIQDAVATANILYQPLLLRAAIDEVLPEIQRRREFPHPHDAELSGARAKALSCTAGSKAPVRKLAVAVPAVAAISCCCAAHSRARRGSRVSPRARPHPRRAWPFSGRKQRAVN